MKFDLIEKIEQKSLFYFGLITFIGLFVLALVYFKERCIFLDSSFYLFYLIKDADFTITHHRFGSIISQLIPFICLKLNSSLEIILKFYSVGFILINFLLFAIIYKYLKSKKFALALMLFNILMVTDTFYWMVSEFPLGISLSILFFAIITSYKSIDIKLFYAVCCILLVAIVFIYPLIIFPFLFIAIYLFSIDRLRLKEFLFVVFSFCLIFIVKLIFFKSGYESNSSLNGFENFRSLFPNFLTLNSNINFLAYTIKNYHFLPLGLLVIGVFYFKTNSMKKMFFILSVFIGYLLMINITYPNGAEQFYIENLYLPLSIFVIFPLVFEVLPSYNFKLRNVVLTIIIVVGLVRINQNHETYTARLDWMRNYMALTLDSENKKQFIAAENVPKDLLIMTWASPYEFWLLSTIETDNTRSILIDDNLEDHSWILPYNKKFATKWGAFDYSELPQQYFNLTDTTFYIVK